MSKVIATATREDYPVGKVALTTWNGTEYRIDDETMAVLIDNDGVVYDLANNIETAINHVQDGQGTAIALRCDDDEDVEDVQEMLDDYRAMYLDCFGL